MHPGLWWGKPEETTKKTNVGGMIILKWMLEEQEGVVWTGLTWPSIGTNGVLL
jgi:hypothetical protein